MLPQYRLDEIVHMPLDLFRFLAEEAERQRVTSLLDALTASFAENPAELGEKLRTFLGQDKFVSNERTVTISVSNELPASIAPLVVGTLPPGTIDELRRKHAEQERELRRIREEEGHNAWVAAIHRISAESAQG